MSTDVVINPISSASSESGIEQRINHFLAQAEHLRHGKRSKLHGSPDLMLANCQRAADAFSAQEVIEKVRRDYTNVDLTPVHSLPELASAMGYAARQASAPFIEDRTAANKESVTLARRLRKQVEALAEFDLIKPDTARTLRLGRGRFRRANFITDAIACLQANKEKVGERLLVSDALLTRGTELASTLWRSTVKAAATQRPPASLDWAEKRDLLFALLTERYDLARRLAYWVWGEKSYLHVPPLKAGMRQRRGGAKQPAGARQKVVKLVPVADSKPAAPAVPEPQHDEPALPRAANDDTGGGG